MNVTSLGYYSMYKSVLYKAEYNSPGVRVTCYGKDRLSAIQRALSELNRLTNYEED